MTDRFNRTTIEIALADLGTYGQMGERHRAPARIRRDLDREAGLAATTDLTVDEIILIKVATRDLLAAAHWLKGIDAL